MIEVVRRVCPGCHLVDVTVGIAEPEEVRAGGIARAIAGVSARQGPEELIGAKLAPGFLVLDLEKHAGSLGWLPQQLGAGHPDVPFTIVIAGCGVFPESLTLIDALARESQRHTIRKRHIDHAFDFQQIVVAGTGTKPRTHFIQARLGGDDVERSCRRVSTIQGALGAFEDLHSFQVKEVRTEQRQRAQRHLVDIDAHGRVVRRIEVVQTHASYRDDRHQSGDDFLDMGIGGEQLDVLNDIDPPIANLLLIRD